MIWAANLSLVFFGLLAYFNAIHHPFVHDDVVFILQNPHIKDLSHWYQAFYMQGASDGINTYYRPVLEVLYRLEYFLFGSNPAGFHFFNVLVHIINGLLIFRLLKKLAIAEHVAWIVSLIFLIHPVQTEAVSCIAGISNLWVALCVLLALNAYIDQWYAVSFLFFLLGMLSKEQGIMLIPMVMVLDIARGQKQWQAWVYWILSALVFLWLRHQVTGASLSHDMNVSHGELYLRLEAIPRVLGMDLRLIFWPCDLHYYRSTDILQSNTLAWILGFLTTMGIIFIYQKWSQVRFILILGLGWFIAALLPVLNIVPLINEYSFILTAEHFLYLPMVGVLLMVVYALYALVSVERIREIVLGVIITACLMLTWYQNTFWRSEIAVFERMLQFEPNFGRGHLLLAKAYYFDGRYSQADGHFQKAFDIMTGYVRKAGNETARKFYRDYLKEIFFDWAQNDCALGQWQRALGILQKDIEVFGDDAKVYNNMAFIDAHLGDKNKAIQYLKKALQADPAFEQARQNLAILAKTAT